MTRRAADPSHVSSVVSDPVAAELDQLGVRISLPSDRLTLPAGQKPDAGAGH
jgi:hypothetical protein